MDWRHPLPHHNLLTHASTSFTCASCWEVSGKTFGRTSLQPMSMGGGGSVPLINYYTSPTIKLAALDLPVWPRETTQNEKAAKEACGMSALKQERAIKGEGWAANLQKTNVDASL